MFFRLFHKRGSADPVAGTTDTARPPTTTTTAGSKQSPVVTPVISQKAVSTLESGVTTSGESQRALQGDHLPPGTVSSAGTGPAATRYPLDPESDAELLVLLVQQYSITSIAITHYRVKGNYVEYVIECIRGNDAWRVYRRYQQFKALDHALRQLCVSRSSPNHGLYGVLPVLPGSHWMEVTNQSPELVEQRRRYLEIYLQQLVVPKNLFYVARTALYGFLHDGEVPTPLKWSGIQPLLGLSSTHAESEEATEAEEVHIAVQSHEDDDQQNMAVKSERISEASVVKDLAAQDTVTDAQLQPSSKQQTAGTAIGHESIVEGNPQWPLDGSLRADAPFLHFGAGDEHLPPATANCVQCNAEFTSFLYPHRCFFCRAQYCSACLCRIPVYEGVVTGNGAANAAVSRSPLVSAAEAKEKVVVKSVHACRQCAENYKRRLDRCGTASGGAAYNGMQSTLGGPMSSNSSVTSPSSTPACGPVCVGSERSPTLFHRRTTSSSPLLQMSMALPPPAVLSLRSGTLPISLKDFQLLTVIGRGTFGKVIKVQHRDSHTPYAMKVMNKSTVYKRCMTSYMKEERAILMSLKPHPYVVQCHFAFQTEYYLIFVLDYLPGGELYDLLYPVHRLSREAARFYAAELVLALEHLHRQDVVHRDLKPENVVLTQEGHACLTDFGLARRNFSRSRRRSFVGSPEYVAPETIQGDVQTAAVDWWSFGVMLYEMLSGRTPFRAYNNNAVYENVLRKDLGLSSAASDGPMEQSVRSKDDTTPSPFSPEAASLLQGLLARDPATRLQDPSIIKAHPFFDGMDWAALQRQELPAPFLPTDLIDNDVRHFKREFISEWAAVPPLTTMTRASIDALTKCFEPFPVAQGLVESRELRGTRLSSSTASPLPSPAIASIVAGAPHRHAVATPSLTTAVEQLYGVWQAKSIGTQAVGDGRVIFPWGGKVDGLLIYNRNGTYALQLTPSSRRPLGPVQDIVQISREELCDAYCSYSASFGQFKVQSWETNGCGVVRQTAVGNLCPNLVDVSKTFQYSIEVEETSEAGQYAEGNPTDIAEKKSTSGLHSDAASAADGVASSLRSRTLLRLSTAPQRVPSQGVLAFTFVVWEKISNVV